MTQEVESDLSLFQEGVPHVLREVGVGAGKDGEEVSFEGADGSFGGVAAVDIRRD